VPIVELSRNTGSVFPARAQPGALHCTSVDFSALV